MYGADTDKRKLLSVLSHGSIFFNATVVAIGIPIAILIVSDDPVVKENAKEAINFHLNVGLVNILWAALWIFLAIITLGLALPLFSLWVFLHWGLTIWAIWSCLQNPEVPFRYPFIFRVI
ncbi:DUF4870 domain-containing protein [Merismopedia glauca]|uniref:DUF4870 domain-containing protein n=1 Tax=Merismopedia glauca CCAP 1448/3 TaxID=1296344 RepID=A0A2T1C3J6_9CYAN|nr:DUF4870 domain-containing protein [Merismopedia glauca]PSB02693.1 DUF4870 domain-containing protein [Merismopedia glauca CCAP 1448/3]